MKIAVTGATGYIGGRLVPRLLADGHEVVCLVRNPAKLDQDPWRSNVEVVAADVLDTESLNAAMGGCDAAYYLVHSMGSGKGFEGKDKAAAANFAAAAAANDVDRIVYLGGMGDDGVSRPTCEAATRSARHLRPAKPRSPSCGPPL